LTFRGTAAVRVTRVATMAATAERASIFDVLLGWTILSAPVHVCIKYNVIRKERLSRENGFGVNDRIKRRILDAMEREEDERHERRAPTGSSCIQNSAPARHRVTAKSISACRRYGDQIGSQDVSERRFWDFDMTNSIFRDDEFHIAWRLSSV
jgi:hypothetical protein